MGGGGVVRLSVVWALLEHCLGEYETHATDHYWCVKARGKTYPSLPLGKHGKREDAEIQKGHVRKMARHFEILDCAKQFLE